MEVTFSRLGRYGRLGNQMFQIASTIGIAAKNWCDFGFPQWINHTGGKNVQDYFKHPLPTVKQRKHRRLDVDFGYHDIILTENTDLQGYLQSERYFEHCTDLVRHYFEFKRKADPLPGCAIHIRRGDYQPEYYNLLGEEYYLPAMERLGASRYTVFTDSPEQVDWIAKYADIRLPVDEVHDLQDYSLHESYIIGNSTYSWWAAWLGQGETMAPRRWFGWRYQGLDTSEMIPKDWILL
jgi:Glycosyl transferase family 11.